MVEIDKPAYEPDEPIHQVYRAGAEQVYFETKRQKMQREKMARFREGIRAIREKYLSSNQ